MCRRKLELVACAHVCGATFSQSQIRVANIIIPEGWVVLYKTFAFHLAFFLFFSSFAPTHNQHTQPSHAQLSPLPARETRALPTPTIPLPRPCTAANEKNIPLPPSDVRKLHLRLRPANPTLASNTTSKPALHRIHPSPRSTTRTAARLLRPSPVTLNSRPLPA